MEFIRGNVLLASLVALSGYVISHIVSPRKSSGIQIFEGQVAGHLWQEGKIGMLKKDNKIFKPLQSKQRGQIERDFYEQTKEDKEITSIIPQYFGVITLTTPIKCRYLILEDLTYGMKKPCVLDLKLGQITHDCFADEHKILREMKKYKHQPNVWRKDTSEYISHGQKWGRTVDEQDITEKVFHDFFFDGETLRKDLVKACSTKLDKVIEWFNKQHKYLFFCSSLLFVYDSETDKSLTEEDLLKKVKVVIIDFSHVYENNEDNKKGYVTFLQMWRGHTNHDDDQSFNKMSLDYNTLYGIEKSKGYLQQLLEKKHN